MTCRSQKNVAPGGRLSMDQSLVTWLDAIFKPGRARMKWEWGKAY
jgi:hypothetical protein